MLPSFKRTILELCCFAVLALLISSCSKNGNGTTAPIVTPVYDFTWSSASASIGDTVSFQSTAPGSSTFLWTFFDGTTSTLANPKHVFAVISSAALLDTVSLMINRDSLHVIKKVVSLNTKNPKIKEIAGNWNWKGYGGTADSSFPIIVESDSKIIIWGTELQNIYPVGHSFADFRGIGAITGGDMSLTFTDPKDTIFFTIAFRGFMPTSPYTYIQYYRH